MAAAIQELYPEAKFGVGPVVENGFYYDVDLPVSLKEEDIPRLGDMMRVFIKRGFPYEKKKLSIGEAIKLFAKLKQSYKVELLTDLKKHGTTKISSSSSSKGCHPIPQEEKKLRGKKNNTVSIYQTGGFIDLCRGPHVASTNDMNPNTFKLERIAGAYWRGDEKRPMLTRIYGVLFQTPKELQSYLKIKEEREKRDHRKLGAALDLFHFEDIAPGAAFWHPKGMIIIKELERFWREIHEREGYLETSTPILVKHGLFERSGHLKFFKENMFTLEIENESYALKPMNCPESTRIYAHTTRSYRDLPLRLSEIGLLHRNERSGVLIGLTRVRQITMDDAHIYARPDQVQGELTNVFRLVKMFYKLFDLKPTFHFATRPLKALGDPKLWERAEKSLTYALKENNFSYEMKPGEGAFYGPKIDIQVTDSLERSWQMATVQLDLQMPERFDLEYIDQNGKKQRPAMIHRAIFGSFERFIGILLEHTGGALPLWLSPVQVNIIPVGSAHEKYARGLTKIFKEGGIRVELADQNETVGKKIRGGELRKIPYLAVVGDREMKAGSLRIRSTRSPQGKEDLGEMNIEEFNQYIQKEIKERKSSP